MNIVVIDTLIQTINIDGPIRNGLVRSALMDVEALSTRHRVHFMYYGLKPKANPKWSALVIGKLGVKDYCNQQGINAKYGFLKVRKDLPAIIHLLKNVRPVNAMIIHVFIKSKYLQRIAEEFISIPILFIFHDQVYNNDIYSLAYMLKLIAGLKQLKNSFIITNSDYTKQGIISLYRNRYSVLRRNFQLKSMTEPHMCFDHIFKYFAFYPSSREIEIVDNKNYSVNIGRYTTKKGVHYLFGLTRFGNFHIWLFGHKDEIFDKDLKFFIRLQDYVQKHPGNYQLCQNYSQQELQEEAKYGRNLIISCPSEGFGFTAFEMGIYGLPVIILKKGEFHATEEYLKRIGANYISINILNGPYYKKELYDAITAIRLTRDEKLLNARRFFKYFTLQNYLREREELIRQTGINY